MLFEDLRVEYWGAREENLPALDQLSTQYRRFYFLRRSLVTLDEFGGAISRLNALRSWSEWIQTYPNEEQREIWNAAIKFFGESKKRFATFRNDIGGHYQEKSAQHAVEALSPGTTGKFAIDVTDTGADTKLHFATELVARLLVKDRPADAGAFSSACVARDIGSNLHKSVFDRVDLHRVERKGFGSQVAREGACRAGAEVDRARRCAVSMACARIRGFGGWSSE